MRNRKQKKTDTKLVDKFLQYRKDFEDVCKQFEIDYNVDDKKTLIPLIVEWGDMWMHSNICPYFQHKNSIEEGAKEEVKKLVGSYGISTTDLNNIVDINLKVEKGDMSKRFIDGQRNKHKSSLFISNMMKRTFDTAIDDTMTDFNHVVIPKQNELKFVKDTNKSEVLSKFITDLTDSRREYLNIINPQFEKILHAIVYASGCTLTDEDAKAIMMFAHCPDGDWHRKKSPMWSITEKAATAYRLITKNNLYFHPQFNTGLDEVNFWLGLHGLKLVDDDFDVKEKQYIDVMKGAEEAFKNKSDDDEATLADFKQDAIQVIQYLVYGTKIDEHMETVKEFFGLKSEYMKEKRRKEFEESVSKAKYIV